MQSVRPRAIEYSFAKPFSFSAKIIFFWIMISLGLLVIYYSLLSIKMTYYLNAKLPTINLAKIKKLPTIRSTFITPCLICSYSHIRLLQVEYKSSISLFVFHFILIISHFLRYNRIDVAVKKLCHTSKTNLLSHFSHLILLFYFIYFFQF